MPADNAMPAGIGAVYGVIGYIRIPVPGLRINWVGNNRVWLDKPAYRGVIESCLEIRQPDIRKAALTGVTEVSLGDAAHAGIRAYLAEPPKEPGAGGR